MKKPYRELTEEELGILAEKVLGKHYVDNCSMWDLRPPTIDWDVLRENIRKSNGDS